MRINVINPKYLTDNHLIAEYRETKMITYYYIKSANTKTGIDPKRISERYTLNKGHGYMWYNKFGYIDKRFKAIIIEMRNRGFKTNFDKLDYSGIPKEAFGDFIPDQNDIRINLDRILIRIAKQPRWYKFYGKDIDNWDLFYEDLYKKEKLLGLY
jgi:deoxyribonuclease (pyrimidine dimer)